MKFQRVLLLIVLSALLFSCKTSQPLPTYLQNISDTTNTGTVKVPELIIQKGDILSIQIMSLSTKPEASDLIYNQPNVGGGGQQTMAGYLVDNNGDIIHHRLGIIHAEGLTKQQLAAEIRKRLTQPVELLSDPTVVIRLINFKVTLLGQVAKEGVITVTGEKITVLEAIGLAGGINDFGKKTGLKVLREINGKREMGKIDLSSKDIFDSPYYYLAQNDVVIVDESNKKMKDTEQARTMQKISFALTLVTVAATITTIFTRN
jgi:polysaccharide export outer membrane protein